MIGLALVIVAVWFSCALLFRLSVHALPLWISAAAAWAVYRASGDIALALIAALCAAITTLALARIALGAARSTSARLAVGLLFAVPAAIAGYHAVHGIAAATMPGTAWPWIASMIGAGVISLASWPQWARPPR